MTKPQHMTAIIYDKRGRPISIGQNSYLKTHPIQAKAAMKVGLPEKQYLHAEIDALIRLKDWKKADKIVITRYTKDGKPGYAKPCKVCEHMLALAGITKIEHT